MKVQTRILEVFWCLLILFSAHQAVFAQLTEGSLSGAVTDAQNAAVPGVNVSVRNQETGETRQALTDDSGVYRVASLRPGLYEIKAERTNFKTAIVNNIQVVVNNTTRADVKLEAGQISETVTVSSEPNPINTEEGRVSGTLNTRQVQDLPTNGRELYSLALLQPGVTATLAPVISNTQSNRFNSGFSANGATPRGNNFVLDGVSNNNEWLGGTPAISPSVESIAEFQVQTVNFSAEYGRNNGSVVIAVSRTGTNALHGSVYDYLRNDSLDARNFFDAAGQKGILKRNQFGFSFGGPVRKDKTFYFINYEGIQEKNGFTITGTGETPELRSLIATFRAGTIANTVLQSYPAPACVAGTQRDVGSVYGLRTLTAAQVRAIPAGEFFEGLPDGSPDVCEVNYQDRRYNRGDQFSVRLDHQFTQKSKAFARFLGDYRKTDVGAEQLGGAVIRGYKAPFNGNFPSLAIGHTQIFSSSLLNDFRFGYIGSNFGIGFKAPKSNSDSFPTLFFDDGTNRFGGGIFVPRNFKFKNFNLNDTLTLTRGAHNLKVGGEFRRIYENSDYQLETLGFYEFQSILTFANDAPYYAEGLVNPTTGKFTNTARKFRWSQYGAFIQDDWKIRKRLTLNLGLRYDYFAPPSEADGKLSNITLGTGSTFAQQIASASVGRVDKLFNGDKNNFAPRLGFAYDVTGKGTTALRGSYAIAYLEPYSNLYTNASRFDSPDSAYPFVFPYFYGGSINYTIPASPSTGFNTGLTPRGGIPGTRISVSGIQRDIKTAYSEQWFLGVQQKLFPEYYLSANYVGTAGKDLYIRNDVNRFAGDRPSLAAGARRYNQEWAGTTFIQNGSDSIYHGANFQLQKAYSKGYYFTVNYTVGKALDTVSDPGLGDYTNVSNSLYTGTQDANNPQLDHGPSEFDVRHRLTIYGIWDLPKISDAPKFVKQVANGWQLNLIFAYQTGRPFTVTCTSTVTCDYNGDGNGNDRPNTPAFGNSLQRSGKQNFLNGVFQVSDFPRPAFGTNGNLGRNTFRGPDYQTFDASLFKTFKITERVKLQFRAEGYNLFNRVNLYLPNATLNAPLLFGKSTAAFPARQFQFALKALF